MVLGIHDQSDSDWQCWAYAISTMLRTALRLNVQRVLQSLTDGKLLMFFGAYSNKMFDNNHHKRMRMELMMLVFPIRANTSGIGVDPRIVINRVSTMNLRP